MGSDFVDGPLRFDGLQGNPRFQFGALGLSLLWHELTSRDSSDCTP
jgi:hypothetical protein